ncbi:MAG: hypothetical protein J6A96_00990 [Clostridia bacterium]|nr:hypothetical protein [Clostridia bacterium]
MSLNEFFEKQLNLKVNRAAALTTIIQESSKELAELQDEITVLDSILTIRRNQG